jgi:uncharacterized protein YcbK (DUF882 family)
MPTLSPQSLRKVRTLAPHAQHHALQLVSEFPLLQVSSAYRSARHNARVKGSPTSFHIRRRAADFIGPDHDLQRAADRAWTLRVGPRCTGPEEVLLEFWGTRRAHLHVAW